MIVFRSPRRAYFPSQRMYHPRTSVQFVSCNSNETMPSNFTEAKTDDNRQEEAHVPAYLIRKVHVSEEDDTYSFLLELPGVKEQNVSVTEHDNTLTVEATRMHKDKPAAKFHREFSLNKKTVDAAATTATLTDGILTLTVPKTPEPQTHSVTPSLSNAPEKTDETLHFHWEIPGVKAKDLGLCVADDGKVSLTAERTVGATKVIKRSFMLDEETLDVAKSEAYLMDGILTIVVPKKQTEESPIAVARTIPLSEAVRFTTAKEEGLKEGEISEPDIVVETVKPEEEDADNWEDVKEIQDA